MRHLRANSWLGASIGLFLSGCATSSYRVLFESDRVTELSVTPDRVQLECEYLQDADIAGLYGFMIHVLDEADTVTTLTQTNTLDKNSCDKRLREIGKILDRARSIYIAGRGSLRDEGIEKRYDYSFPGRGKFTTNGKVLGFAAIANEKGLCYDAFGGPVERPCPSEPFPFWNKQQKP